MSMADLVQAHLPAIFEYCEHRDTAEIARLSDGPYCRATFRLGFAFCASSAALPSALHVRYWPAEHVVLGRHVRVTSQWYPANASLFAAYLRRIGVAVQDNDREQPPSATRRGAGALGGRYEGHAIGNAQNPCDRDLLRRIGSEAFTEAAWEAIVRAFNGNCAYCGRPGRLMDHIVPINKRSLGEHRLGNVVPSCAGCNADKGDTDFRAFLLERPDRLRAIESHMAAYGYTPLGDDIEIGAIVQRAHEAVRALADAFAQELDLVLSRRSRGNDH